MGSALTDSPFSRRSLIKGLSGAVGLAAVGGGVLAACSSSSSGTPAASGGSAASSGAATGTITFGSNYSDPSTKTAFASLTSAATTQSGVKITTNTVDHNTFQNNISTYLQGTPDDLATWFAGYRMQFFAAQGLLEPIDDVWDKIGANFNDAGKSLSKGLDGHYYFV
ncbi:MAG TPA: extracellular solute-binding protein, partial [Actinomycetes bacterium]